MKWITEEQLEEIRKADLEIERAYKRERSEGTAKKRRDKRRYYVEHREERLEYQKKYYREHAEERRAYGRAYKKQWREGNATASKRRA